jgi:ABC-type transport system substrate-binding protein
VVFVANPTYFRRPGRQAEPFVREIRFVDLTRVENDRPLDPVAELKADRLQIVPDFPTRDYDRYAALPNVAVATAAVNRRVHLLAFNLRDPRLQSADLRRGILHAVDREKVLTDVYRAGKPQFHRPLTGPFPVGSWAEGKGGAAFNRDLAAGLFGRAKGVTLDLLYPADDDRAKAACEAIAGQVAEASGNRVTLTPEGVKPADFHKRVAAEHRFSVAYLSHDYTDDWFPLGLATFLDPDAAGANGRNVTGFGLRQSGPTAADDALAQRLLDATRTRDFDGKLKPLAHDIHKAFADSVPFVPLWQLDRHLAVSRKVKIQFDGSAEEVPAARLDPTPLFQNVSRWRVE